MYVVLSGIVSQFNKIVGVVAFENEYLWSFLANIWQECLVLSTHCLTSSMLFVPLGAYSVWKLFKDLFVFLLMMTCGGIATPAALTAPMIVVVSRFLLVWLCSYFMPFAASTLLGLSSCTAVSSIFQIDFGFSLSLPSLRMVFNTWKYLSTLSLSMHWCRIAAIPSGWRSLTHK